MEWSLYHFLKQRGPLHNDNQVSSWCVAICVVSSERNVLNHFFAERTKFNATVHCKVMYYKFTHWMKDKAAGGACVIQQDYNPAHMTNNTQLSQGVRSAILGKGFVALQFT